jgi:hypothetical protein
MANNIAFQPMGKTYKVSANTGGVSTAVAADSPVNQFRFYNSSASDAVFVRIGGEAKEPNANAEYGVAIGPGDTEILTGTQSWSANVTVGIVAAANTPVVYVTPGEGL